MLKKLFVTAIVVIVLIPVLWLGFPYYTARTVEIAVLDKERVPDGEDGSYYLVFTEEEVFKNVDVWRRFKTASSDIQGRLQVGRTFRVRVYGWRIPILSRYRNIVSIESEVTPAMTVAVSLPDLDERIEWVRETKLPVAVLFPHAAHPSALSDSFNERFPDIRIRVFGDEPAPVWGLMVYWDPSDGPVLEAVPLASGGEDWLLEWGPGR